MVEVATPTTVEVVQAIPMARMAPRVMVSNTGFPDYYYICRGRKISFLPRLPAKIAVHPICAEDIIVIARTFVMSKRLIGRANEDLLVLYVRQKEIAPYIMRGSPSVTLHRAGGRSRS